MVSLLFATPLLNAGIVLNIDGPIYSETIYELTLITQSDR